MMIIIIRQHFIENKTCGIFKFALKQHYRFSNMFLFPSNRELTQECPTSSCCGKPPVIVTTLLVEGASGLELPPESKVKSMVTLGYIMALYVFTAVKMCFNKVNENIVRVTVFKRLSISLPN